MLVKSFIGEARDLLESVVRSILELEADPTSTDLLNEIFRAAHTLKGSAGVVGLAAIQDIAHALEDLLERLRSGATTASPETIDVLLAGFDAIKVLVEALERGEDVSAPPELVVRIKNLSAAPAAVECASPDPILRGPDAEGLERLPHAARCNILRYLESKTRVYQIVVEPDARVFFLGLIPCAPGGKRWTWAPLSILSCTPIKCPPCATSTRRCVTLASADTWPETSTAPNWKKFLFSLPPKRAACAFTKLRGTI
ncbi:MAG: Hpt domain-containing protein [Desulfotomaculales bacterium]